MSRWKNYNDRLDEKVSKQEIELALKNDNILIGCEFEFILPEDTIDVGDNEGMELWNGAVSEVERYNDSVRQYERDLEDYDRETQEMVADKESFDEKRDEFTDAISDAEDRKKEWNKEISDLVKRKKEIEKLLTSSTDENEISELKKELSLNGPNIKLFVYKSKKEEEYIKKWNEEIKLLTKKIDNLDDEIKSRENNRYEEIDTPYFSEYSAPEYFDYMTNYLGYSKRDLYVEPGEFADEPPEWDGGGSSDNFIDAIENSKILDNAPFSDYKLGTYGNYSPSPGSKTWAVEDDSSLGENGVEIKSPPMPVPNFVKSGGPLESMFDWIDRIGDTDSSCGFHCHMSLKNTKHELDYIKLILFTDEGWIYTAFSERAGSYYAKSMKDKMIGDQPLTKSETESLFNKKDLVIKSKMKKEHYDGVSLIDEKIGHVEFRYMGGSGYHRKYKEVRAIIGAYAHNLALATDPEYRRKEYILKLERITNKTELFVLNTRLQILTALQKHGGAVATDVDKKMLAKMIVDVKKKISSISGSVKLDASTEKALRNNHGFYSEMLRSIYKSMEPNLSEDLISIGRQYI